MAVCVAIIAKDNYPLFVRTVALEDELKFTYIVHTTMDIVEEKINSTSRPLGDIRDSYLGLLYPTEDYRVYGYVTNTKVKFIIITEAGNVNLRDNDVKGMFKKLHLAYVNMTFNPFYVMGEQINSKALKETVTSMMVQT